jgi:hypothetical protein
LRTPALVASLRVFRDSWARRLLLDRKPTTTTAEAFRPPTALAPPQNG